ncbi:hypothetical protein [Streptomyces sp. JV184]|nr:hypothetical protein [Streptomyces sp. JV184]MEE1745644.1 hypothetical protein [Streptomyces sp. JV184]
MTAFSEESAIPIKSTSMTLRHWVLIRFSHFHHPCADAVAGGVLDT